jgi:hypothetical protein
MKGVHKGATGVKVTLQGDVLDIGSVYWSSESAANILSFGAQVEAGADTSNKQPTLSTLHLRMDPSVVSLAAQN